MSNKNNLIFEAIDESIEFEEIMDLTDFDSWLEDDNCDKLEKQGQDVAPYKKFKKNEKKLRDNCNRMKNIGTDEVPKNEDKSSLERYLIYQLFDAKDKRIEARICPEKEAEKKEYEKAIYHLLSALTVLQNPEVVNADKKWEILLYNDLSICYAGLDKTPMSRGYAKEAREIIEKEREQKEFKRTSRLYNLYTVALFNQAVAERRSHLNSDAEMNFKKIIEYAERNTKDKKVTPLRNFNYYSALLYLSDLYIDLGRGNEAIELLDKVIGSEGKDKGMICPLKEDDIRYWKAYLNKITALIDQSDYEGADKFLKKFITEEKEPALKQRHKVTSSGFIGINHFARCIIEDVDNTLNMDPKKKTHKLKIAKGILIKNIDIIKDKRKQQGLEMKTYKHLSKVYTLLDDNEKAIENSIKYLSNGNIDNLKKFVLHEKKMKDWINDCDDLDFLESFVKDICVFYKRDRRRLRNPRRDNFFGEIREKIKKECEAKGQLSRAERSGRQIAEVTGEKEVLDYKEDLFPEKNTSDKKGLTKEDIYKRLDINEKDFDSVLFKRTKIKEQKHIAEVIVLRRWNSFSPGLFRESTGSLGGGYLLRINKHFDEGNDGVVKEENKQVENIVIDPGYNFLQNFRSEGFYINDIDTIIVTHSHPDHCAELLPIMELIFQFNKRYVSTPYIERRKKKVNLCLSQGAYKKFSSFTNEGWQEQLKDVIILENLDKMKWNPFDDFMISAVQTPHLDLGGVNAIGLKIKISRKDGKQLCLGFTSDTPWDPKIRERFKRCDLLCVHLGSIKYQEIGYTDDRYNIKVNRNPRKILKSKQRKKFNEAYAAGNHLLFHGTLDFVDHCANKDEPLVIVSEFGEELKYGLRTALCRKLKNETNIDCLPGDVGLYVGIKEDGTKKVRCNFCEDFVRPKEIETFLYGREDAIHYICQTCGNTLSELQKQAVVEHRTTRH